MATDREDSAADRNFRQIVVAADEEIRKIQDDRIAVLFLLLLEIRQRPY